MEFRQDQGMMRGQDNSDPKTALWQFCQRFCKGPVAKTDIQFNSAKVHPNGMQATVKLLCLQGQEFAGEICSNAKDAEKSAAQQALQFYGMEAPRPQANQMAGMSGMAAQQLLAMSGGMPGGVPGGMPGGRSGNAPMQGGPGMFNPAAFQMMGGSGAPMGVSPAFGGPSHGNFAMAGGMGGGMDMPSQAPSRPRPDNRGGNDFGGKDRKGSGGKGKGGGDGKGKGDRTRPQGGKDGGRGKGGGDRQEKGGRGGGGRGAGGPGAPGHPGGPAAPKAASPEGAEKNADGDVDTSKSTLNVVCMKLLKRPMQKGEIIYDSPQTPGGFQSILTLPCLPEPWGKRQWTGKVCANRKTAEQDAAEKALADIKAAPEFAAILASAEATGGKSGAKKKGTGDKDGEGKGKGKGKGKKGKMMEFFDMMWGGGKGGMKGGPDLERQPVSEAVAQGEVVEWKGNFGWIKPKEGSIDHEALARRGGRVYVHKQDLQGVESLEQGTSVKFKVYVDASGLGASEVVVG